MEYYLKSIGAFIQRHINYILIVVAGLLITMTAGLIFIEPIYGVVPVAAVIGGLVIAYILSKRAYVVAAIVIFNENFFYMFNRFLLIYIYDLRQLLGLILFAAFILYLPRIVLTQMLFKKELLVLMGYYFFSIFIAYKNFGQPFLKGIYTLYFPFLILSYFVICFILEDYNSFRLFKRIYIVMTILSGCIYILQSFIYPSIIIILTDFRYRYGNVRFTEFSVFMTFGFFMTLNIIFEREVKKKSEKILVWIALLIQVYTLFMIAQNRLLGIIILVLVLIMLMYFQTYIKKHYIYFGLAFLGIIGIISMAIILQTGGMEGNIITDSIDEVLNQTGNVGIRVRAIDYYIKNLDGHWLFGWGALNLNNNEALWISGRKFLYYMVDVGIIGYIYQYGIIGLIITFVVLIKGIKVAFLLYKSNKKVYYPLFIQILVLLMAIQVFYFQESAALFHLGLWLAFIEFEFKKVMRDKNENINDITVSDTSIIPGE